MRLIDADKLETHEQLEPLGNGKYEYVEVVYKDDIDNAPTIEPERKKGKWIDYTDEGYVECPFCHSATNCDGNNDELRFCFSCGAELR